jgi:quercetin dioxygenase-like cupin family protein
MPDPETSRGAARAPEATAGPFLTFDLAQQIRELRQESYWQSGRNSKTLAKYSDFRIVLTALQAKTTIHEHHSAGRISVQTIEGHLRMHAAGKDFDLPAGRVLVLDRALPHDVVAIEDSAFLLTIAWPEGAEH